MSYSVKSSSLTLKCFKDIEVKSDNGDIKFKTIEVDIILIKGDGDFKIALRKNDYNNIFKDKTNKDRVVFELGEKLNRGKIEELLTDGDIGSVIVFNPTKEADLINDYRARIAEENR